MPYERAYKSLLSQYRSEKRDAEQVAACDVPDNDPMDRQLQSKRLNEMAQCIHHLRDKVPLRRSLFPLEWPLTMMQLEDIEVSYGQRLSVCRNLLDAQLWTFDVECRTGGNLTIVDCVGGDGGWQECRRCLGHLSADGQHDRIVIHRVRKIINRRYETWSACTQDAFLYSDG